MNRVEEVINKNIQDARRYFRELEEEYQQGKPYSEVISLFEKERDNLDARIKTLAPRQEGLLREFNNLCFLTELNLNKLRK